MTIMWPFTPKVFREAVHLRRAVKKLIHYRRDLLSEEQLAELSGGLDRLESARRARDVAALEDASKVLLAQCEKLMPSTKHSALRENIEMIFVAGVIALGIRAYFVQPFKIPTGSMQPTLNGVIGYPITAHQEEERPFTRPALWRRVADYIVYGRRYFDLRADGEVEIVDLREYQRFHFFTYTEISFADGSSTHVNIPAKVLIFDFGLGTSTMRGPFSLRSRFSDGEPIVRGYVDTGDQLFVNKFSYHFRQPRRGDVFVFKTRGIHGIESRDDYDPMRALYYIKRLGALPGDRVEIDPPSLKINGERALEPGFVRVMSEEDGYRGYALAPNPLLGRALDQWEIPPNAYFALGDNSFGSFDSRGWGYVPERNVVGPALFVYYPFAPHWGRVR